MRVGTPGFNRNRLTEARESRGLTMVALADLVDLSAASISSYETGKVSPSPDALERLAGTLNFPGNFFLLPDRDRQSGTTFYRSMSTATKRARTRAEWRAGWLRDITEYVSDFVTLPDVNLPYLGLPDNPLLISNDEIEEAAMAARQFWNLPNGPISNMVLLLENQGVVIARDAFDAGALESLCERPPDTDRPFVIIGTDKGTAVRWRFDVAHELGHLLLHSRIPPGLLQRKEQFKEIETQAHRFAAAFLLPLDQFADDLFGISLDAFRSIKPKWKTSIAMMIRRARDGRLISEETERGLWVNYTRRKWRTIEPLDDSLEPEIPRLLAKSFELILSDGLLTPSEIPDALGLLPADAEDLSSLPRGYLAGFSRVRIEDDSNVVRFPGSRSGLDRPAG